MDQGSVLKSNRSQAVRLPKSVAFPDDVKKVDVIVLGTLGCWHRPAKPGPHGSTVRAFRRTSWWSAINRSIRNGRHCRRPCGTCLTRTSLAELIYCYKTSFLPRTTLRKRLGSDRASSTRAFLNPRCASLSNPSCVGSNRSVGPWSLPARCFPRYAKMTELRAFRLFTPSDRPGQHGLSERLPSVSVPSGRGEGHPLDGTLARISDPCGWDSSD